MTHTHAIPSTMKGAYLPGDSTVALKDILVPEPGHGEVLIRTKSSTICGSDIRAIYHEHLGKGAEGYNNKVAGHEPSGQIVKCGPGLRRFREGDQVAQAVKEAIMLGYRHIDCASVYGNEHNIGPVLSELMKGHVLIQQLNPNYYETRISLWQTI